jgi:hypothetical protein
MVIPEIGYADPAGRIHAAPAELSESDRRGGMAPNP